MRCLMSRMGRRGFGWIRGARERLWRVMLRGWICRDEGKEAYSMELSCSKVWLELAKRDMNGK